MGVRTALSVELGLDDPSLEQKILQLLPTIECQSWNSLDYQCEYYKVEMPWNPTKAAILILVAGTREMTNVNKPTTRNKTPEARRTPASHPVWSCQPSGFSILFRSKNRDVPVSPISKHDRLDWGEGKSQEYPFQSKLSLGLQ